MHSREDCSSSGNGQCRWGEGGGEAVGHRPFLDIEHDPNNFFPIKALFSDSFRYLVTKF